MGFLEGLGRSFPQKDVVIIHNAGANDEVRIDSRAIIQSKSGQFNVDTPIYEGDYVEVADPRGGVERRYVAEVRISDVDGNANFRGMGHISVQWGRAPQTVNHAPTFHISGGWNQIAWANQTVTQQQAVESGDLRAALARLLEEVADKLPDGEDRDVLQETAKEALTTLDAGGSPSRRTLATLKGILGDVAAGASRGLGNAAASWASEILSNLN